mgnify:CR=1 FL=1
MRRFVPLALICGALVAAVVAPAAAQAPPKHYKVSRFVLKLAAVRTQLTRAGFLKSAGRNGNTRCTRKRKVLVKYSDDNGTRYLYDSTFTDDKGTYAIKLADTMLGTAPYKFWAYTPQQTVSLPASAPR